LALEALDHADALAAALALGDLNPRAYRSFNMIIADNRDAFWLRHADPSGTLPLEVRPIAAGLAMIAAGDLDETETLRLVRYRPRFAAAGAPDPGSADWAAWEALLADDVPAAADGPMSALRFVTERGFATVSSALIALPGLGRGEVEPVFRYRTWQPRPGPWSDVLA
ncbi:MAG TPA: hypothetical protein VJO12_10505, partial [Stellaceae bacterium]|nr:hypothetical protein [Stellaceae bacterium]